MDVSTLSATNSEMEKHGIKPGLSVMDAGSSSENNIISMMEKDMIGPSIILTGNN